MMTKKLFLLTIALLCLPLWGLMAWAQNPEITYVDRLWDEDQKKVVEPLKTTSDYIQLPASGDWYQLDGGKLYYVQGDCSFNALTVNGIDAQLILADGCVLNLKHIKLEKDNSLHIYGMSGDTGKLVANNDEYSGAAGIGGGKKKQMGALFIHGGYIIAHGAKYAAGIGGGDNGIAGWYHQYGGTVEATGGDYGAGVGSGDEPELYRYNYKWGGTIQGYNYIYGGKLSAWGGEDAAGIGGGNEMQGSNIIIWGGEVYAKGNTYAAGIGSGDIESWDFPFDVTINGGKVTAIGGDGSGSENWGYCKGGAGIGGGYQGHGANITINGGIVNATGGRYATGIGAQSLFYRQAQLHINGGTVTAMAGPGYVSSLNSLSPSIAQGMKVMAGNDANTLTEANYADNYKMCNQHSYSVIKPCTSHYYPSYTVGNNSHSGTCLYCNYQLNEAHTFVEGICQYCGKNEKADNDMWTVTLHRASAAGSTSYADRTVMMVVKGQDLTLPAVNATEGLTLMGYATSWTDGDGIEMRNGETLLSVGTVVTPDADISYYPRYRYRYEPTWTWNDANATATLSIKCSALSSDSVDVTNIAYTTEGAVMTATGTYSHNGATYTFTDTYILPLESLALYDAASNEEKLNDHKGRRVNTLMLSGRTLYEDGSWNTLCLPFDLSQEEVTVQLSPNGLKTLSASSFDSSSGTLTLTFADTTAIKAGKPYLIKWTANGSERRNPIFSNVVIKNDEKAVMTDYVDFIGSFSPVTLTANNRSVLYLGADNKLYYPSTGMTVGSCRAVFCLNDITAGDLPAGARSFVLNFGDGEETTGISSLTPNPSPKGEGSWYDLQGRRISVPSATSVPSVFPKGVYINNGKKIIIK